MKKNFSKALAGTLTVAMVLGMAAPAAGTTAQAYAKNGIKTKYSAIYAGKTKTYTLKTAKPGTKWSVTGEGKQYVTLSAKKGKSVKATIAKDAPAGIKATVVAKLKKGKKYKKVDADKFTIKVDATAVNVSGSADVKTGATATYTATTTPAKTTNHVYFTVTDKEGKATTGATISTTSGVLTAKAAGEYKVNVATARGDVKAAAGQFTANASMDVKVTDPAIPDAKLTSAKQTEAKKIVVTFDSEVKELKNDEVTVVCDSDKSTKTIKAVTLASDKKSATIETLVDTLDGKTYTVTYKGSTAQFTASDGTVADFSLNNTEFQIKKKQELKVNVLDKNQVIVKTIDVNEVSVTDGDYQVNVTSNDGYFTEDKLVMQNVGKTEEVTVGYKVNDDKAKIEKKFKITAVAQAALASSYVYATITDEGGVAEWSEEKCNLSIPISEKNKKFLFAKINDVKGIETITDKIYNSELGIDCVSSDDNILLVNSSDDNVELTGVKAGTAYVQVRQNGKVMLTIPVTVTPARALTNVVLDGANKTLSNSTRVDDDATIKLKDPKDQYGKTYRKWEIEAIELKGYPTMKVGDTYVGKDYANKQLENFVKGSKEWIFESTTVRAGRPEAYAITNDKEQVLVAPVGTYKFEVTFKDKDNDKTFKKTQIINVKHPDFTKKPTLKLDGAGDVDVAVKKIQDCVHGRSGSTTSFRLKLYYEGVWGANALENVEPGYTPSKELEAKYVTLLKNGSKQNDKVTDGVVKDVGEVSVFGNGIEFQTKMKATENCGTNDDIEYTKKVEKANYQFKVDTDKLKADIATQASIYAKQLGRTVKDVNENGKELTKTLVVKDSQPELVASLVKTNVDASTAYDAITKAVTFKYDGVTYKKADKDEVFGIKYLCNLTKDDPDPNDNTKKVKQSDIQYYKNGKVFNIVKMKVFLSLPNVDDDDKIPEKYGDEVLIDKNDDGELSGEDEPKIKTNGVMIEKTVNYSITVNA